MPEHRHLGSTIRRCALPQARDLRAAFAVLTALPFPRPDHSSAAFAGATVFFPVASLAVGAVLAGLQSVLADRLPPWVAAIVLVGVWEGLRDDGNRRSVGVPVTGAAMLAKTLGLAMARGGQTGALLFAPLLASWSMVVLAVGARDAAEPGRKFNSAITFREFAATSVFTGAVVFTVAEGVGIFLCVCVGALALALRLVAHRWANGVTWRVLLASAQAIETVVVLLFALL